MFSTPTPTQAIQVSGKIQLYAQLSKEIGNLFLTNQCTDVTFCIDTEKIPAHRAILAARSCYFRALLFGGFVETTEKEITLTVPASAFKFLLQYIYSGEMSLDELEEDKVLEILCLANEYGFVELVTNIAEYLGKMLKLENVWKLFDIAQLHGFQTLTDGCWNFVDLHAIDIIDSSFETFSQERLCELLKRDTFYAVEINIFNGVQRWITKNPEVDSAKVLSFVRLPIIPLGELFTTVKKSGLLNSDQLLQAIEDKTNGSYTNRINHFKASKEVNEVDDLDLFDHTDTEVESELEDSDEDYY